VFLRSNGFWILFPSKETEDGIGNAGKVEFCESKIRKVRYVVGWGDTVVFFINYIFVEKVVVCSSSSFSSRQDVGSFVHPFQQLLKRSSLVPFSSLSVLQH
jgi:hypothetical protein